MRRMIDFACQGDRLAGSLDEGDAETGLLIVSGGNEIRSGAYAGQAAMAQHFADKGHPVFRYDRRGVGDSEGENGGFESSADDIAAAVATFRAEVPHLQKLVAFGNCDAATALALFHAGLAVDALVLANPWVIEPSSTEPYAPTPPSTAAIRARYLARLKNPRSLLDLFTGKINLMKFARGLAKAVQKDVPSGLAYRVAIAISKTELPIHIITADHDKTALVFTSVWQTDVFFNARTKTDVQFVRIDTASHSFADVKSKSLLFEDIRMVLVAEHKTSCPLVAH